MKPKKILKRTFTSLVQNNFKLGLLNIDSKYTLDIHLHSVNHSFEQFLKESMRS